MASPLQKALPNAITLLRLAVAGGFFAVLSIGIDRAMTPERAWWGTVAVTLFVVAAATDAVDGWLARRWEATSVFGRIMDPFVDKVLVLGAFVYLAGPALAWPIDRPEASPTTGVLPWMVVVLIARELLVTSVRGVVEGAGHAFGADRFGKAKMVLQSIAAPVSLFVATRGWALESDLWRVGRDGLVWATVVVTALSVVPYLLRARVLLAKGPA